MTKNAASSRFYGFNLKLGFDRSAAEENKHNDKQALGRNQPMMHFFSNLV